MNVELNRWMFPGLWKSEELNYRLHMDRFRHNQGNIQYFQKGLSPRLFIISGEHGAEYETIPIVYARMQALQDYLDGFLYVPEASPSAVANKTRTNGFGHDINRQFFSTPVDPEVEALQAILVHQRFDLCLDFHEDADRTDEFYIYDTGRMSDAELEAYRKRVIAAGARLYSGIDDTEDPQLRCAVDSGYIATGRDTDSDGVGFASSWILRRNIAKRYITIEIPMKADLQLKTRLVVASFDFFLPLRDVTQ